MNILSVKIAGDGYRIDHLVNTKLGLQTWATFAPQEDRNVADWIARGNQPAPADSVPVADPDPVMVLQQAMKDKVGLTDAELQQAAAKVAAAEAAK